MLRTTNPYPGMSLPMFGSSLSNIREKMTGNKNFPNQQEAMGAINKEGDVYVAAVAKAVKGSTNDRLLRDKSRATLNSMMRNLGNAVTEVCEGNVEMMDSSGMEYTGGPKKKAAPFTDPAVPRLRTTVLLNQVEVTGKKQNSDNSMIFEITSDPAAITGWDQHPVTTSKCLFTNLSGGQQYFIRYILVGTNNRRAISPVVSFIPQKAA